MSNNYIIITDSNTDLSPEMVKDLDLQIMSMPFTLDGKEYFDNPEHTNLSIKDFYTSQRDGVVGGTSALNPSDISDFFEPFLKTGKDVIYIAFSSGLSTTFRNGSLAAESLMEKYPDRKVVVVDSLAASMGQGLLVYHSIQKQKEGYNIEDLEKWVIDNRNSLCHWFTVDDLFHLKRGGRVSAAAAVIGSALSIKPVLHVDNDGHLIPVSKVRGRRQSLNALVKKAKDTGIDIENQTVFISHGDSIDDAKYVEEQLKETLNVKDIHINNIGPIIGTHSGAGTIALFFIGTEK